MVIGYRKGSIGREDRPTSFLERNSKEKVTPFVEVGKKYCREDHELPS